MVTFGTFIPQEEGYGVYSGALFQKFNSFPKVLENNSLYQNSLLEVL